MPINIYKPLGWTPLEALEEFKKKNPEYKGVKMSYAGRLDPMAEGVLLLLVGDELKNQEKYQNLDKEYEVEILFGTSTDSHDVLGISKQENISRTQNKSAPAADFSSPSVRRPCSFNEGAGTNPDTPVGRSEKHSLACFECGGLIGGVPTELELVDLFKEFTGKVKMPIPAFSSYEIKGKPLFWWAKEGRLDEIEIPERETEIYSLETLNTGEVSGEEFLNSVLEKIKKVKGDFRQEETMEEWQKVLSEKEGENFPLIKLKINCSSGTYVRSLANELGKKMKTGALLYSLKRTRVGNFGIKDSLVLK